MAKSTAKKSFSPNKNLPPARSDLKTSDATQQNVPVNASLLELFTSELEDMYWAELHLVKALPKLIAAAGEPSLQQALSEHLDATILQVSRLEEVFSLLKKPALPKKNDAMEGLTMSGEQAVENTGTGTPMRDLGIIMSGLKVENFEMTAYAGMIQVANALGFSEIASLLQQNLDEETEASEKLTGLSGPLM